MKKYLVFILGFIFLFFSFSISISAKSEIINDIRFKFGEDDILNLGYSKLNSYKIRDDNTFYYDGVKYALNDDYTKVNDSILVSNEKKFNIGDDILSIDTKNKIIVGSIFHETYSFSVTIEFLKENTSTYKFSQKLCYKYNNIDECNEDKDDTSDIINSSSFSFYYDFLPFYKEEIVFEELTFVFTLKKGQDVITSSLSFNEEEINYKDHFRVSGYNNIYIGNDNNYYLMASVSTSGEVKANFYYTPMYINNSERVYSLKLYICRGINYSECGDPVFSSDAIGVNSWDYFNITFPELSFDSNNIDLAYNSFKLRGEYVCKQNCNSDSRSQKVLTSTNEEIYYLNVSDPIFKGTLQGVNVTCNSYYYDGCYVVNKESSNKVEFVDDNDISNVYYLISDEMISDGRLVVNEINNGDSIVVSGNEESSKYIYYKVVDGSGYISYYGPYLYYFDFTAPSVVNGSTNFDSYSEEDIYNDVNLTIRYQDEFTNTYAYFKVIKESDYNDITKEDIIENDTYSNMISIKEHINEDGVYRVCFVGKDPVGNYSDMICSKAYYLDITNLTKNEVSVSGYSEDYKNTSSLNIAIVEVSEGVKFRCGLFKEGAQVSEDDLYYTCSNKSDNVITFNGEGSYKLWIYASDNVGNYSLLEFDDIYLLDNIAPSVNYVIIGNNLYYANDIKVNVDVSDMNNVTTTKYQFYSSKYNENDFRDFNVDADIAYPFDYYGEYKLAIKVCDSVDNCSVVTKSDTFFIDTGIIKMELIGEEEITIFRWGKYVEKGVSAKKGKNNVNVDYTISGSVDSSNVGVYYVTYTSGTGMNMVSVTRTVKVLNSVPYIAILISLLVIGESIILARLFVKKRKNDSI